LSQAVTRLVEAYRAERQAYARILELAEQAAEVARKGRPMAELHRLNAEKRAALAEVEALERSIAADKARWRHRGRLSDANAELDELLSRITDLIERILECELETDRWILNGADLVEDESSAS
jgi:hypothetical protein